MYMYIYIYIYIYIYFYIWRYTPYWIAFDRLTTPSRQIAVSANRRVGQAACGPIAVSANRRVGLMSCSPISTKP